MPQRHSKNNNDLAFFTYEEKRKLGYGTQKERLGKDSIKPFDACCLCLQPFIDPLCCPRGHLFCKECIYQCLLEQKKDIKRKLAAYEAQQKQEKDEEQEKRLLQRASELEYFDRQNHSAVPTESSSNNGATPGDRNNFHGANSVKTTSFEEEALRTMKAFWLPSATPGALLKVNVPSTDTTCPEENERLKLKSLFPVHFTEEDKNENRNKNYICPSCKVTLTNTIPLMAVSTCGHVFCKKCGAKFVKLMESVWYAIIDARRRIWCRWRREGLDSLRMGINWKPLISSISVVGPGWVWLSLPQRGFDVIKLLFFLRLLAIWSYVYL